LKQFLNKLSDTLPKTAHELREEFELPEYEFKDFSGMSEEEKLAYQEEQAQKRDKKKEKKKKGARTEEEEE